MCIFVQNSIKAHTKTDKHLQFYEQLFGKAKSTNNATVNNKNISSLDIVHPNGLNEQHNLFR